MGHNEKLTRGKIQLVIDDENFHGNVEGYLECGFVVEVVIKNQVFKGYLGNVTNSPFANRISGRIDNSPPIADPIFMQQNFQRVETSSSPILPEQTNQNISPVQQNLPKPAISVEWVAAYKKFEQEFRLPLTQERSKFPTISTFKLNSAVSNSPTIESGQNNFGSGDKLYNNITKPPSPNPPQPLLSLQSQSCPTNRRLDRQFVFIEETLKSKNSKKKRQKSSVNDIPQEYLISKFSVVPQPQTVPPNFDGSMVTTNYFSPPQQVTCCRYCNQIIYVGSSKCSYCRMNLNEESQMTRSCPQCAILLGNPSNAPNVVCSQCKSIVVWQEFPSINTNKKTDYKKQKRNNKN